MKKPTPALAFLILAGCATSKPPNVVFLGSGIELQSVPGSPSMLEWSSRPGVLGGYHAFFLAEGTERAPANGLHRGADPRRLYDR